MVDATSGRILESWTRDRRRLGRDPAERRDDVDVAVAAAKAAFPVWSALSPDDRAAYLRRVADLFVEHGEELAALELRDNGNPLGDQHYGQRRRDGDAWTRTRTNPRASTGRTVPLDATTLGITLREPYGVIAVIVPFNMPLAMLEQQGRERARRRQHRGRQATGSGIRRILRFAELVNEVLPPGTVNIVSGLGDVGDALVRHVDVAKVTMTGSSPTAKLIQAAAADTLTPAIFELGGKSPNIVLDDADLDIAPSASRWRRSSGSTPARRVSRVPDPGARPVFEEVLERIEAIAESIVVGDPA